MKSDAVPVATSVAQAAPEAAMAFVRIIKFDDTACTVHDVIVKIPRQGFAPPPDPWMINMRRQEVAIFSISRRLLRQLTDIITAGLRVGDLTKPLHAFSPSPSVSICGLLLCALFCCSALAQSAAPPHQNPSDPGVKDPKLFDPKRSPDGTLEGRVADGFTLAAVGDCIITRPLSQNAGRDPEFAAVLKILRAADATYGNMEMSILDLTVSRPGPNPGPDDWPMAAAPAVAKDLKAMGFSILSRANNHALDWGNEGMRETSRWLDEADLVYAGVGLDEGSARAPRYFESAKGRIAIVSMASTFTPNTDALDPHGAVPGRAGISALHLKKYIVVPESAMEELRRVRATLYPDEPHSPSSPIALFGSSFETGSTYSNRYQMDPDDLLAILKSVRLGRQDSDFLITAIHSHEPDRSTAPDPDTDMSDTPAKFLQELGHSAIDSGADAFMTTGIHHLGPIEVYRDRPIFYGLGNFFWADTDETISSDVYRTSKDVLARAFQHPERVTDTDVAVQGNFPYFAGDVVYESILAVALFRAGRLSELRLYPIDLGYDRVPTESGTPRLAKPEKSRRILERLRNISTPYGTRIEIEGSAGVVRLGRN